MRLLSVRRDIAGRVAGAGAYFYLDAQDPARFVLGLCAKLNNHGVGGSRQGKQDQHGREIKVKTGIKAICQAAIYAMLAACTNAPDSSGQDSGGQDTDGPRTAAAAHNLEIIERDVNSATGRGLFVSKGCVICHAVNGVGGKAATALDAEVGAPPIDPLEFSARMWRGAPAMIELQSIELGYTIYLTADEIADLSAFAADRDEQKRLTIDQLPENIRNGLLDEQFWEMEDWEEFLRSGQEELVPEQDSNGG